TDAAGNHASATQVVTVEDHENPTISAPAPVAVGTDLGQCSASTVSIGTPTFTPNGPDSSPSNAAAASFATGSTTFTWTVTDAAGNHASATQVVTVEDHENPTLSAPAPVTVGTGPGATLSGTVVSALVLGTPMVNDNCPGVSVAVAGIPAGNFFPVG